MIYHLSKTLFLAGERADPDTLKWAEGLLKVPVIDHWWQTGDKLGHQCKLCRLRTRKKQNMDPACKPVPVMM